MASSPSLPAPTRARREAAAVDAIRRIVRGLRLAEQQTRAETGLSAAQLFVLTQLAEEPAASLSELGTRTLTDRSSVAAVVDRLLERRLVERAADPRDRRRVGIRITAGGRALLRRGPTAPTTLLLAGLRSMSTTELTRLSASLESLVSQMGLGDTPAAMFFEDDPVRAARRKRRSG